MQWLLSFVNRYRGFFLTFTTFLMRWIFIGLTVGLIILGGELDPHIAHIFRAERENILKGPNREILDLDFRADGNWLAGASKDGSVYLWDFNNYDILTSEQRKPIELPLEEGHATQIAFCPGDYLVSAGTQEGLRVWMTPTLRPGSVAAYLAHTREFDSDDPFLNSYTLGQHKYMVQHLILSPDGRWLASADSSGEVILWNTGLLPLEEKIKEQAIRVDLHGFPIVDIEFSSSGEYLAISDVSGTIFLLDMGLIEDPYNFANSRRVLQHYDEVSYDLIFDEPLQKGQPSRYLFAAGPSGTVTAFNLQDTSASPSLLPPSAHDGVPMHLAIVRESANEQSPGYYWLVSLDDEGRVVFWDLNRYMGYTDAQAGQEYYTFQLMSHKPVNLTISLAPERLIGDTARSVLFAGSPDRSIRLLNLSTSPETWELVQLRSLFGTLNDVEITDGNGYIASTSGSRVRVWEVSRVSNFENAIPWRSMAQFLIAILLVYVLLLQSSSTYIMNVYGLASRPVAAQFLLNTMFGFYFETWPGFLLSLLVPVFPSARVENGHLQRDPDRFPYVDKIGGPGRIHVRPGNVAAFQTNRMQTNVVTNLTYWLRPFERVRNVISLDDQYFEEKEIETYTRDGIKITLRDVRVYYRVPQLGATAHLDQLKAQFVATGESPAVRRSLANAFDRIHVDSIENLMDTYGLTKEQGKVLAQVKILIDEDRLMYINRGPNQYSNVDREALQKAIDNMYWALAIERPLIRRIRNFINRHPLDYFCAPGRYPVYQVPEPNGRFRIEFREQVIQDANVVLRAVGGEVTQLDVGTFEIKRKEIEAARYALWNWNLRRRSEQLRSEGQAALEKARIEGRLKAEMNILEKLIEEMKRLSPYHADGEGLLESHRRAMTYSKFAGLLRRYLRVAKSEGTFPPPWMGEQGANRGQDQTDSDTK